MIKKHLVFWIVIVMVSGILAFGGCAGDKTLPEQTTAQNLQMEFAYIPAGEFVMGSPSYDTGRFADEVLHKVEITESFYIQTTEVTQHQWETVMGNNPSEFKHCGLDCPVENVSWNDAQKFIKRLNQRQNTGKFRLPTEAEWEYACRLGAEKGKLFDVPLLSNIAEATDRNVKMVASFFSPIGKCLSTDEANYNGNYPLPHCTFGKFRGQPVPVASFPPNNLGIYDLYGNVNEWCFDNYGSFDIPKSFPMYKCADPQGPEESDYKVYRGGSWLSSARYCRPAFRGKEEPDRRNNTLGLRLVKTVEKN